MSVDNEILVMNFIPSIEEAKQIICDEMSTTIDKVDFNDFCIVITQYSIMFQGSFFGRVKPSVNMSITSMEAEKNNSIYVNGIFTYREIKH